MNELAASVLSLGQQVLQQQRDEGGEPTVCFVSLAPFLLGAGAVALHALLRAARRRWSTVGQQIELGETARQA